MEGYDPIMLEFYLVKEWLKESEENFVILGDFTFEKRKVKGVLLKKSYFLNENPNDIYNICILSKNGDLLPKDTFRYEVWRNIGKYLQDDKSKDKYKMIFDKDLIKELKKKNNVYNLRPSPQRHQFISRELLEMSTIGTLNSNLVPSEYQELYKPIKYNKVSILAFEDAFFDAKISEALKDYGDHMYTAVNGYLRYGDSFLGHSWKWNYVKVAANWKALNPSSTLAHQHHEAKKIVKQKIKEIDRCFLHYAERNEDPTEPYYRGQVGLLQGNHSVSDQTVNLYKEGSSILVHNFLSVSLDKNRAKKFIRPKIHPCCLLTIYVDKGIPMINMSTNAKYLNEKEYLLPRNLKLTCEKVIKNKKNEITGLKIRASAMNSDQFKVNTNCTDYPTCDIKSSKMKLKDLDNLTHKNVEKELKPIAKLDQKEDEIDKLLKSILTIFEKLKLKLKNDEFPKVFKILTDEINEKYNISWPVISITKDKKKINITKIRKMFVEMEGLMNEKLNELDKDTTKPKKICPPGKELYEKTNRCRKIKIPKKEKTSKQNVTTEAKPKKICPPGKELYPKTNRCRKIKTPKKEKISKQNVTTEAKPKKICPPGKELYEKTNRCRKIKTPKKEKTSKQNVTTEEKPKKLCPPGKELNPKTYRCRKIKTPKKKKDSGKYNSVIKDVLNNLITINGHGSFSSQKIKVPDGFQVLIPHRNGLDVDYTTPDAGKNKLYEEELYKKEYLNYREGWKLYLPGDDINNLGIHVFHDGASCQTINDHHTLQKDLIEKCEGNHSYDKFCPLYCTQLVGNEYKHIPYKGKRKLKIKACGDYRLKDLFNNLRNSLNRIPESHRKNISPSKDGPIVLIPFTCNAKSGSQRNNFDHNNHKKLNTIYQELVKNR